MTKRTDLTGPAIHYMIGTIRDRASVGYPTLTAQELAAEGAAYMGLSKPTPRLVSVARELLTQHA